MTDCCTPPAPLPTVPDTCKAPTTVDNPFENRTVFQNADVTGNPYPGYFDPIVGTGIPQAAKDAMEDLLMQMLAVISPYDRCPDTLQIKPATGIVRVPAINEPDPQDDPFNGDNYNCCADIEGGRPHYFTDLDQLCGGADPNKISRFFVAARDVIRNAT